MKCVRISTSLASIAGAAGCLWLVTAGCTPVATVTIAPAARTVGELCVTVLDFAWDPSSGPAGPEVVKQQDAGVFVADCVAGRLGELPGVKVVPRETVRRVAAERIAAGEPLSELVRAGKYGEIARLMEADALVIGEVRDDYAWVSSPQQQELVAFSCRCVDARSAQTLWTMAGRRVAGPNVSGRVDPGDTINQILDDAIRKLKQGMRGT